MRDATRPPTVSVVVCAFSLQRADTLAAAVDSLLAQTSNPEEVVVVIDHAPELARWAGGALRGVRLVENRDAPGLSGARNCGVAQAGGDVVAFLDDDAVAAPDWIERLQAAYANPAVVAAGGAVLPAFVGLRPGWMPEEFDWVVGCSYRGLPRRPAAVRNLIGCNMSFRREALARTGGFARNLGRIGRRPLGCEETDLCIRLGRAEPESVILYDPDTRVAHRVTQERARLGYFVARCHAEGISKAGVTRRCGRSRGLESERAYVRSVLPAGVRRGVGAALRGDRAGLGRAAAIVLGLAATGMGYASGSLLPLDQR
jgi:GT2 family glycosyltransferase